MKPIGPIIKKFIEENQIKKMDVAEKVGISYNYLSTIFQKNSIDAELLERICFVIKLNPNTFFETSEDMVQRDYRDIKATKRVPSSTSAVVDGSLCDKLLAEKERIIEEKERTIQILLKSLERFPASDSGHDSQNH